MSLTPSDLRHLMATAERQPGETTEQYNARADAEHQLSSWRVWLPGLLGDGVDGADGERWRAFISSDRFYVMGWAGFTNDPEHPEVKPDHDPREWLHFTLNIWDKHPAGDDRQGRHGRAMLLAYVDHRRAELRAAASDPIEAASARAAWLEQQLEDARDELSRLLPIAPASQADGAPAVIRNPPAGAHLSEVTI